MSNKRFALASIAALVVTSSWHQGVIAGSCDANCAGYPVLSLMAAERWTPLKRSWSIAEDIDKPVWLSTLTGSNHLTPAGNAWMEGTGLVVGGSGADITVHYVDDTSGFDAPDNKPAYAALSTQGGVIAKVDIYINCFYYGDIWNDETPACPSAFQLDLTAALVHELGHALALDNQAWQINCSVMWEGLYLQDCNKRAIKDLDKQAMLCLYPELETDATVIGFGIVDGVARWTVVEEHASAYYVIEETTRPDVPGWPIHFEGNGLGTHNYATDYDPSRWYRLIEVDSKGKRQCLGAARPKTGPAVAAPAADCPTSNTRIASGGRESVRIQSTPGPPTCAIYADVAHADDVIAVANDWEYRFGEKVSVLFFTGDTSESARLSVHNDMKYLFETFGTRRFHIIASDAEIAGAFGAGTLSQSAFLSSSDQELADFDYDGVPDAVVTRWLTGRVGIILDNWERMGAYAFFPAAHGTRSASFLVNDREDGDSAWPGSGELTDIMADDLKSVVELEGPDETIRTVRASSYPDMGDRNVAAKNHINTHKPELVVILATVSDHYAPGFWFSTYPGVTPIWTMNLLNQGLPPMAVVAASCWTTRFNHASAVCNDFVGTMYGGSDPGGAVAWMGPFGNVAHQTANHVFSREVLAEMFAHPYRPMADSWLAALTSSYAELGQVSDYRKTLNMMVFLGDPLTPFRCFPRISGYAKKSGTLYSMPWATAVVCPLDGTGHADDVVGEIAIDARDFSTALPAQDLTISPPASSSMSFFPSLDVVADGASTLVTNDPGYPQGCYKATFTVKQSGGCGEALSTVKLQGEVVGHARVKIKSPDLDASGAVDLVDFSTFGNGFPVDPAVNDCRDFNNDNKVNMVDFSTFALHNGHETQGQIARGEQMLQSNAGIVLRFTEEFPTATQHRLYVDVDVESFSDVSVSLFALVAGDERLTFHEWLAGESVLGTVMFSPVERDGEKQLYFGALTSDQFAASEARLGRLVFDVSGSDPVEITDASFVMRTGEVLVEPEGGSPIVARMSGVLERVLDAEIVRIYHDRLEQNFPNPFNPTTTLAFSIKDASNVRLTIYDVAGRQVRELVDEQREPGAYKIVWDGHNDAGQRVSSGVYFFRLVSGSFTDTKKMTILK